MTNPAFPPKIPSQPVSSADVHEEKMFCAQLEDRALLSGPNSRLQDLRLVVNVLRDFIRGFRVLHFVGPCITVFGSARFGEQHPYYILARKMGSAIAQMGFTIMTGGGRGIMEAANRGAKDTGGRSVGCNIKLPMEQQPNAFLDRSVTLDYFFVRKTLLMKYSYGFIIMPGGFGTMDEMFEALTLIQTKKIRNFPIVIMGREYWADLAVFIRRMVDAGTISAGDLDLIRFTDSVEEAVAHLNDKAVGQFGLHRRRIPKKSALLGEGGLAD